MALPTSLQHTIVPFFIPESGSCFSKLPLSSCIALSFHATMDMIFYPHSLLWEGVHFPISFQKSFLDSSILHFSPIANFRKMPLISFLKGLIFRYFSIVSSIILHCSINPCFWEGVAVACQTFLLLSCLALSFHAARDMLLYPLLLLREGIHFIYYPKSALDSSILDFSPIPNLRKMSFDHSFLSEGIDFFAFLNKFFYHCSLLCQSMLLGDGGCCMSNFSFIILHCFVIPHF